VRQDAFQFFIGEQVQNALSYRHGRVLRVAFGGEGIGRVVRNQVDLRYGDADLPREPFNCSVSARQLLACDRLDAIKPQRDLVRAKIRNKVHDRRERQRQQHAVLSAEETADEHQQHRKQRKQERGLECVSHRHFPFR